MLKRKLLLSLSLVSIQGCVLLNPSTIETIKIVSEVKTVGDGVSSVSTGKMLTDHAISKIVNKDCSTFNLFKDKNFCRVKVTYEVRNMQETNKQELQLETMQNTNLFKEEEKLNESKLGTRHPRHAYKVRGKRSNFKAQCKPSSRISGVQDKISTRRTGRNETCSKNRKSRRNR
jgi:hypothetical protein